MRGGIMIDKNDFDAIDLTRSTGHGSDDDLFDEDDFLRSLERANAQEHQEAYAEHDYSLDEYMKMNPDLEREAKAEREAREQMQEKVFGDIVKQIEQDKNREKTEEEKAEEDALANAPWNDEQPTEEDMDDMYRDYVKSSASQYGLANADEVEFDKLAQAVGQLDDLYYAGRISKPVKTNGSLIVSEKGEVIVAGVSPASDWESTTDAASDLVKNMNYDAMLEDDGR